MHGSDADRGVRSRFEDSLAVAEPRWEALAELSHRVRGAVRTDPVSRSLYSSDASLFEVMPHAVFSPEDEADVATAVRLAGEHDIPIHGRGAGTGLAGESLGSGLVLDFSRPFRSTIAIQGDTVRVQPGVVCSHLNAELARHGRRLGPDPASAAVCTVGGMVANNASGAQILKYGYMRDYVREVRVVGPTGRVDVWGRLTHDEMGAEAAPLEASSVQHHPSLLVQARALRQLLAAESDLIAACQPKTRFNRCGYLLHDLLGPDGLDLARLFVGSEGTLGVCTEVVLRTVPLAAERGVVFLGFANMESAARAVPLCLPREPSACELVDRRLLALATEADPSYEKIVTAGVQAALLVEFEADRPGEARRQTEDLLRQMLPLRGHGLTMAMAGSTAAEVDWLWRVRTLALPLLHRLGGREQPVPFIEDVSVPLDQLPDFLHRLQDLMQKHQATASYLVHAGSGQVHARPFLDLRRPEQVERLRALADELYALVLGLGGSISAQHSVGLARCRWVSQQYGRLFGVMREVKNVFDPGGLFNPGKIFGEGVGDPLARHLRQFSSIHAAEPAVASIGGAPAAQTGAVLAPSGDGPGPAAEAASANGSARVALQLVWHDDSPMEQAERCNGCGSCRTQQAPARMCPIFRADPDEAAAPRAKANLLRQVLSGALDGVSPGSDAVRAVADLCVNCKMCGQECDALVQIPKLMLETKAQHVAENGLTWSDWFLARTDTWAAWGSKFAWLTNAVLASPPLRWALSKMFGLARHRRLPTFAAQSFLRRATRRGWTRLPRRVHGPKVVYFVDVFANYNDPAIAEATVAVLHHLGIEVYVPPQQVGSGMSPLAYGDVETARALARRNLNHLADLARLGFPIICSEPTAAVMLRQDCLDLVGDLDARLVAEQTVELTTYLWQLHEAGKLRRDLKPLPCRVGHHVPCHVKALQQGVHGPALLGLIPGLEPVTIDLSCSGMAGTFGFQEVHFQTSLAAGRPMLERLGRDDLHFGSSECSTCRLQMDHGARKPILHPVQFLALAYGLQPRLSDRLGFAGVGPRPGARR